MSTASALTTAPSILPDRVDARSLRDLTIVDALFLYAMARAGEEDAKWLAEISANHWEGASDCRKVLQQPGCLFGAPAGSSGEAGGRPQVAGAAAANGLYAAVCGRIRRTAEALWHDPLDDLAPDQREGYPSGAWTLAPSIALYWCDGKRTLGEVVRLTQEEVGPTKFDFEGYFRFLAKRGYVEILK